MTIVCVVSLIFIISFEIIFQLVYTFSLISAVIIGLFSITIGSKINTFLKNRYSPNKELSDRVDVEIEDIRPAGSL